MAEYPQLVLRTAHPGVWLSGWIQPVIGIRAEAWLELCYPYAPAVPIKAWAWWERGTWIGPRHTNYGDGSICAYERQITPGIAAGRWSILWTSRPAGLSATYIFVAWDGGRARRSSTRHGRECATSVPESSAVVDPCGFTKSVTQGWTL